MMGLTNVSQQFQKPMEDRLQPVRAVADLYIDDILVTVLCGTLLYHLHSWLFKSLSMCANYAGVP